MGEPLGVLFEEGLMEELGLREEVREPLGVLLEEGVALDVQFEEGLPEGLTDGL